MVSDSAVLQADSGAGRGAAGGRRGRCVFRYIHWTGWTERAPLIVLEGGAGGGWDEEMGTEAQS